MNFHNRFLSGLLLLRQGADPLIEHVWLVARLFDKTRLKGLGTLEPQLFIPDLHLLTARSEAHYRYGFHNLSKSTRVDRTALLCSVLDLSLALRRQGVLHAVHQLGDFLDVWRERTFGHARDNTLIHRIRDANVEVCSRLDQLNTQFVRGNHDYELGVGDDSVAVTRVIGKESNGSLMITHGDGFCRLEALSGASHSWAPRHFGDAAHASTYDLARNRESKNKWSGPIGRPPVKIESLSDVPPDSLVNVWRTSFGDDDQYERRRLNAGHSLMYRAYRMMYQIRLARPWDGLEQHWRYLRLDVAQGKQPHLRGFVIGHSHHPRICIHDHTGNNDTKRSLLLFDCGAWMEWSKLPGNKVVPSCHIGVLDDCDFRIYQLSPHSRLFT